MIRARVFEIDEGGRRASVGDYNFAATPRVGEAINVEKLGRKLLFEISTVLHIASGPGDDFPSVELYGKPHLNTPI